MAGPKSQIAAALKAAIEGVTVANGYSRNVGVVRFDKVKLNISDYQDYELPAVQLIDLSANISHEMSRSKTSWFLTVEICMRSTVDGIVEQDDLWDFQEEVIRAIMVNPKLGLNFVVNCTIVDNVTDLHLNEPNYIGGIGLEIVYYEPITRNDC